MPPQTGPQATNLAGICCGQNHESCMVERHTLLANTVRSFNLGDWKAAKPGRTCSCTVKAQGESRAAASLDQSPSGHRLSASGHPARQTVRDASSETACRGGLRLRAVETHSAYLPRRPQTHRSIFASSFGRLGQLLLLGLAASGGRLFSGGCEDPHEHPTDHCRRQARVGIRVLGIGLQYGQRSSLRRCALMSACIMDMVSVAGCNE